MTAANPSAGPLRRLFESLGWLLAGRGVGAVLSIVYLAIITQSLGPQLFGQFAIILSTVQAIYGVITFNTWQLVVRYGAPHVADGQPEKLGSLVRLALLFETLAACVGFAIAIGALHFFAARFGWSDQLLGYAILFALVHSFAFRNTIIGLLRVRDRFREAMLGDSALPLTRFIGSLILVAVGLNHSLLAFLVVWALSEVANAVALWLMLPRADRPLLRREHGVGPRMIFSRYPGLLRFALLTNGASTFAAINQHVVTLAVGTFLGEAAAGFFRLGYQLGQALAKVAEALSRATFTEFSRLRAFGDSGALNRLFRQANRIALGVAMTIVVSLLLFGKPVLLLVSGPAFLPALPLVILLGSAAAMDIIGSGYESALLAHDRAGWVLGARIAGTAALVGGFALLIGGYAATGAAIAVCAAAITTAMLFAVLSRRVMARDPSPAAQN